MDTLHDATVVITGASSGMGLATAHAFARLGANVVLAARRRPLLDLAARKCEDLGGRALAITADVTDAAQMRDLARVAMEEFGRIDIWINNAGMSLWGPFEDIPLDSHAQLVEMNLLGAINGTFAVLPHRSSARGAACRSTRSRAGRAHTPGSRRRGAGRSGPCSGWKHPAHGPAPPEEARAPRARPPLARPKPGHGGRSPRTPTHRLSSRPRRAFAYRRLCEARAAAQFSAARAVSPAATATTLRCPPVMMPHSPGCRSSLPQQVKRSGIPEPHPAEFGHGP